MRTAMRFGATTRLAFLVFQFFVSIQSLSAQDATAQTEQNRQRDTIRLLLERVTELQEEVRRLKADVAKMREIQDAPQRAVAIQAPFRTTSVAAHAAMDTERPPVDFTSGTPNGPQEPAEASAQVIPMDHNMELPHGGPILKMRGFFDVNLGLGADANPLVYPLGAPPHDTFQLGEFNLFITSQLSDSISVLSETVFASDASNSWSVDVERAELSYKRNDYFEVSAGRFHTSIGYYNTAFHHGTWFQTATGRPFMYYFEDSGGILPVHMVGISTTGLIPHTGNLHIHWIAEVGNGESSSFLSRPSVGSPVQNFLSDTDHKAFNLAAFIRPSWARGLQIGGSYYAQRFVPTGIPHVNQNIGSLYAIYITPKWEFLNEIALLRDRLDGSSHTFNSPLGYVQVSRKLGDFRPYFRYQYVNVPNGDPLFPTVGRYQGPSSGIRMDFTAYAALKLQYNRLYTGIAQPKNGFDSQLAFTF